MNEKRLLLRAGEAGEILGLGRSKTYQLIARGELPSIKIDGAIRVPLEALHQWLERRLEACSRAPTKRGLDEPVAMPLFELMEKGEGDEE